MPGREARFPPHTAINLRGKLRYQSVPGAVLERGVKALRWLLQAQNAPLVTVALAAMLQAPLAKPAGWRNERYCTFITGRTNSFKTSLTQVLLCLYGPEFLNVENVVRWDGTTSDYENGGRRA